MVTKDTEGNDRGIYENINQLLDWTNWGKSQNILLKQKTNSVVLARKWTIPTERPPLAGEVSVNFNG
jgi:hypothetical protein